MGSTLTGTTPAATYQSLVKFGNNSSIGANAQYLSDGLGNNLPIAVSSTAVGLSNTLPYKLLSIKTSTSTEAMEVRATTGNTGIRFSIADNSVALDQYNKGAIYYLNTGASSAIGTMVFALNNVTANNNVTTADERMRITPSGSLLIGTTTESGRLFVKGSGATSATTSLLVQNSAGTNSIQTLDDTNTYFIKAIKVGNGGTITNTPGYVTMFNTGNTARIGPEAFSTDSYSWTATVLNGGPTISMTAAASGKAYIDRPTMIGTNSYTDASAILQSNSTTQGWLMPRMTDAQIRAIATPAVGLMAYNTDLDCPCFYSTLGWRKISHAAM
jgi:hypothetical protein